MNSAWLALILNVVVAVIGVLQATDWVSLVGTSTAGILVALLAAANAVAHAFTPAGPALKQ